jgi:hypothetical protein
MHRKYALMAAVLLPAILLAACSSETPAPTPLPTNTVSVEPSLTPTNPSVTPTTVPSDNSSVSFSADILPILQSRCSSCHGGIRTEEGLNMLSYDAVMAGSENGFVVIPGDAANSKLATLTAEGKMPKRGPKLTPAQIQMIVDWINAGALNN